MGIGPGIDPGALPFTPGPLSFGVGVVLKMTVTRWAEWGLDRLRTEGHSAAEPGQVLFPLLKATADLLMMPKELLIDHSVREELFAALTIRSMCILLEKFQPDDFAPDPVNPAILQDLATRLPESPELIQEVRLSYEVPNETIVALEKESDVDTDLDLEYDFDTASEDELDQIEKMYVGEEVPSRFSLLKELWIDRRDRKEKMSANAQIW